jgi:hypothetical protein
MRTFVCQSCQAVTRRIDGALAPSACPFCRGAQLTELGAALAEPGQPAHPVELTPSAELAQADDANSERPCERGEPCARLSGKDCLGGRGC